MNIYGEAQKFNKKFGKIYQWTWNRKTPKHKFGRKQLKLMFEQVKQLIPQGLLTFDILLETIKKKFLMSGFNKLFMNY